MNAGTLTPARLLDATLHPPLGWRAAIIEEMADIIQERRVVGVRGDCIRELIATRRYDTIEIFGCVDEARYVVEQRLIAAEMADA